MDIILSEHEIKLAIYVGKRRRAYDREHQVTEQEMASDSRNAEADDILGAAGELAFAKHFNLFAPLECEGKMGFADVVMHDEKTVDVKTTNYSSAHLIAQFWKINLKHPDYYALMTGYINWEKPPYSSKFVYRGMIPTDVFLTDAFKKPGVEGKLCFKAHQSELTIFEYPTPKKDTLS